MCPITQHRNFRIAWMFAHIIRQGTTHPRSRSLHLPDKEKTHVASSDMPFLFNRDAKKSFDFFALPTGCRGGDVTNSLHQLRKLSRLAHARKKSAVVTCWLPASQIRQFHAVDTPNHLLSQPIQLIGRPFFVRSLQKPQNSRQANGGKVLDT